MNQKSYESVLIVFGKHIEKTFFQRLVSSVIEHKLTNSEKQHSCSDLFIKEKILCEQSKRSESKAINE